MLRLLAFDLGASNGRALLGLLDSGKLEVRELHRFENNCEEINGRLCWDIGHLYREMLQGFRAYAKLGLGELHCFGIDTWGVDYGLLDGQGKLIGTPRAYRGAVDADMEAVWEKVPFEELFARTGIATMNFNTVYQLYRRVREQDEELAKAEKMLLMPDLLGFLLTGEAKAEYTNATTTMLYDPAKRDWDRVTIRALGIPEKIFPPLDRAGTIRGALKKELAEELGLNAVPFAAVGTHDTASAVAAIPGSGHFAFCSCGTWSLLGTETDEALLSEEVRESNFSNEGTVQGGFRPLKNIMGLWIIQECRREWQKGGLSLDWGEIVAQAEKVRPFRSIIDPDDGPFFSAGNMIGKIQSFCRETEQPVPETVGEVARCVYESLALKYRWAIEHLEKISGLKMNAMNMVGGGIQNKMLMRLSADAMNRPVIAGPVEGAAMGNLLVQAMALGKVRDIRELREIVRRSENVTVYEPHFTEDHENAYQLLNRVMNRRKDHGSL